jgi:hypothetical protein
MGEVYDEDGDLILREYVALTDNLHFFTPDTNPSIIIVSPVDELEDAVEQGVEVNGVVDYGDGLLYEDYIERLKEYLAEILPGIEPTVFSYEALDNNDPLLDGWRGKGLYQYDPEAEVNPTRRGARFFYQVEDIEDPEDEEGEGYPMGRLYHDYWDPLLFGIGEDRDLDMADYPVQRPDLLVCSGQSYWKPKVRVIAVSFEADADADYGDSTIASPTASFAPFLTVSGHCPVERIATSTHSIPALRVSCVPFWRVTQRSPVAKTATFRRSTGRSALSLSHTTIYADHPQMRQLNLDPNLTQRVSRPEP